MSVIKLYQTKEGGYLSPQDCLEINQSLAKIKLEGIPTDQRENVKDYLAEAIKINSVQIHLIEDLNRLLESLEQVTL